MVGVPDLYLWWLAFIVTAWFIPFVVLAYLCYPARMRLRSVRDAVSRTQKAFGQTEDERDEDRGELLKTLLQYRQRMETRIRERFLKRTYILPLGFLALVLNVGFFVAFSRIQPLVARLPALNVLVTHIEPGVLSGFFGGTLYALYSVVTRYRSQDIPPPLCSVRGAHELAPPHGADLVRRHRGARPWRSGERAIALVAGSGEATGYRSPSSRAPLSTW